MLSPHHAGKRRRWQGLAGRIAAKSRAAQQGTASDPQPAAAAAAPASPPSPQQLQGQQQHQNTDDIPTARAAPAALPSPPQPQGQQQHENTDDIPTVRGDPTVAVLARQAASAAVPQPPLAPQQRSPVARLQVRLLCSLMHISLVAFVQMAWSQISNSWCADPCVCSSVGAVRTEEQSPGIITSRWHERLVGMRC